MNGTNIYQPLRLNSKLPLTCKMEVVYVAIIPLRLFQQAANDAATPLHTSNKLLWLPLDHFQRFDILLSHFYCHATSN